MSCPTCHARPIMPRSVDEATVIQYRLAFNTRGMVRWLGLWWYGVPMPIRVHAAWKAARSRRAAGKPAKLTRATFRKWQGCGCIAILKDLWTKITG